MNRRTAKKPGGPSVVLALMAALCGPSLIPAAAAPPAGYYLVWGDEFNGTSLDTSKWGYWCDNRDWGKAYNDGALAVSVSNGHLVITTKTISGTTYTAMVASDNHFRPRYGYYEASINWGDYDGMWSAFWLRSPILGTWLNDPLDDGGEMDVCEHRYMGKYGTNIANIVSDNIHWNGYGSQEQGTGSPNIGSGLATGFHTYSLLWSYDSYDFGIDDSTAWHTGSDGSPPTPPFGSSAYIILSSQVDDGPDVGTPPWAGTIPSDGYPTGTNQLLVDYFHYYAPTNVLFWTGGTSAYWTNTANWVANMPPLATSDLTFSYLSGNLSSILGRDYTVDGLVFLNMLNSASINGSNPLTLGAGGIDMVAADHNVTLNAPINLAADQTWTIGRNNPGNVLTVNGNLAGTATLTKAGYGSLTLSGVNSYSGITTITGGKVWINQDYNLGAAPGSFVADQLSINGGIGTGLRVTTGGSPTFSARRGITLGSSGGQIEVQSGATCVVQGVISGSGAFFNGGGYSSGYGTTIFSGLNTYSGGTTLAAGTLKLGINGALPYGQPVTIAPDANGSGGGAIFDMNSHSQTIGPLATTASIGGTGNNIPTVKLTGALTVLETNSTTFAGVILGAGGSLILDSTSTSTLTLSGANTYTGPTTINGGTLEINKASGIASSTPVTIASGGVLQLDFNTALKSTATLNLAGTHNAGTVNLAFSGTQTIGALYFGATQKAAGTWNAARSRAFTGSGNLSVTTGPGSSTSSTALNLTSGSNPSTYGDSLTFTATVTGNSPGGTVQLKVDGVNAGTPVTLVSGSAPLVISTLPASGSPHQITAFYGGDDNNNASDSSAGPVSVTVSAANSTTAEISSPSLWTNGTSIQFTATVAGPGTPTGNVRFYTNGVLLATVELSGGSANTSTADLPVSASPITVGASYAAQNNWGASTNYLSQAVYRGVTLSTTNAVLSITNDADGTFTLNCLGTAGAKYYIETTSDLGAPSWTGLAGSTNTATSPDGLWSFAVSNAAPAFYRSVAINPAP